MNKVETVSELLDDPTQEDTEDEVEEAEPQPSTPKTKDKSPADPWSVLRDAIVRGVRSVRAKVFMGTGQVLSPAVEDLVQNVLLDFIEHPNKLEGKTSEQRIGYAFQAGRFSAISYVKKLKTEDRVVELDKNATGIQTSQFDSHFDNKFPKGVEELSHNPASGNFYDEVQDWLDLDYCRDALESLPEGQRTFITDYAQRKLANPRKVGFSKREINRAATITKKLRTLVEENKKQSEG